MNEFNCTVIILRSIQPSDFSATKKLVRLHERFANEVLYRGKSRGEREMGVVSPSLPFNRHDDHQVYGTVAMETTGELA